LCAYGIRRIVLIAAATATTIAIPAFATTTTAADDQHAYRCRRMRRKGTHREKNYRKDGEEREG
jgi:hypothetical protein